MSLFPAMLLEHALKKAVAWLPRLNQELFENKNSAFHHLSCLSVMQIIIIKEFYKGDRCCPDNDVNLPEDPKD